MYNNTMSYANSMKNRLMITIVVSLFLLIPYSTYAEDGDSSSEESKPDFIVEAVWDDDLVWSHGWDGTSPQFKIKNIGGPLTVAEKDACRENCNYWIIINSSFVSYNLTYNIATWSDLAHTAILDNGEYLSSSFPHIFGVTDVKVCFDYENPDSVVDESNETNNCWEGTFNFFPDLRWYDGNPNGTFGVYYDARVVNGSIESYNDVFITENGKLRVETAYNNQSYYGDNKVNLSVTIDGEEVEEWWLGSSFGVGVGGIQTGDWDGYWIENTSVVRVCWDHEDLIEETNEDNNCIEKTLVNASYIPDSDGDGVKDDRDLCPGTLEGEVVSPIFGCPDSDGDGYWDNQDICADGDDGVDEDNDDIPDACDDFIDVGETTSEEDSSSLPGPSFIFTIGVLALAAIASRNLSLIHI